MNLADRMERLANTADQAYTESDEGYNKQFFDEFGDLLREMQPLVEALCKLAEAIDK